MSVPMSEPILVGLCGSLRADSLNRKLMLEAARAFGGTFVEGDLRLPLYDGDVEAAGIPPEVTRLAEAIMRANALVIATPEYNKGPSGVLKNALDWVSRTQGSPWKDKPVAILSAAAGRAGGERSQQMLRWCLNPFRPRVLPGPEVMIAQSGQAFDTDGRLKDVRASDLVAQLMADLRAEAEWMRQRRT